MPVQIDNLDSLSPDKVRAKLDQLVAQLRESNSSLELRRGVFRDLVAYYQAVLSSAVDTGLERYIAARSLEAINADPTLADDELVDHVLSNFRVVRRAGSRAGGRVTIVLSEQVTTTIGDQAVFQAAGRRYRANAAYTARVSEAQVDQDQDRLLTPTDDGNWAFTIELTAEDPGAGGALSQDTALIPVNPPRRFVTAFAAEDFTGGRDTETNAQLLQRLQEGLAARGPSSRQAMRATLRADEAFASVVRSSIVGFGDPEMRRDQHTVFPVSLGGRVDWYIRTQDDLHRQSRELQATLVEVEGDEAGIWQFGLDRDQAPGFYEVYSIRPTGDTSGSGSFEVTADERDVHLPDDGAPDVEDAVEGAYSRFQTAVIRFRDTRSGHSALSVGDTRDYRVSLSLMPDIDRIQDEFGDREHRSYGADLLVRAPVPCFVQLNCEIFRTAGEDDPDIDAIKTSLTSAVHGVGFIGRLYASRLHDAVHRHLTGRMSVGAMDMLGRLRYPGGRRKFVRSSEVLQVPDEPEDGVSARTVQFFTDPADIAITVRTELPDVE